MGLRQWLPSQTTRMDEMERVGFRTELHLMGGDARTGVPPGRDQ